MVRVLALAFSALLLIEVCASAAKNAGEGVLSVAEPADAGSGAEAEYDAPVDALVKAFEENDYVVTLEDAEPQILRGNRRLLFFSGESGGCITIYEYQDAIQAREDASCTDEWGSAFSLPGITHYVEWKSVPHFYYADTLIVQYIGTDEAVLALLTGLYGAPFAEGDAG